MFDSSQKKAAAQPFGAPISAAPKSIVPSADTKPSPLPAAPPAPMANAKTGQALSNLFSHMTDAGAKTSAVPPALFKPGNGLGAKAGAIPGVAAETKAAPDPQKAELAAKMAAKTIGQAGPAEQKVAVAAKMVAKATAPGAATEEKAALKEKLTAAVKAAPDGSKAELMKKMQAATANKDAPAASKMAHFAPSMGGGAPLPAQAPVPQAEGGGPQTEEEDRKVLNVDFQQQEWGHWCGPASTRIALSARMENPPTQQELADQLGTNGEVGTAHIGLVTQALNDRLGTNYYENKLIPGQTATDEERDLLWKDIVTDIDKNYPIVANIVAPPGNHPNGYPDDETIYHYISIIGYDKSDQAALVADPAKFNYRPGFQSEYWVGVDKLADMIARKGYSA